jgi:hypothetical protein
VVGRAALVVSAVEGIQHELDPGAHAVQQIAHALDVGTIDAAGSVVRAARIEEEEPPRVLARVQQALHARVDHDAAARIARADEVRVAVPDAGGIEPFPCGAHQLVVGETARQPRQAGIPEALLRPQPPGGQCSDPCGYPDRT